MQSHTEQHKWQKCPSCGFSCPDPIKGSTKLDIDSKKKYPSLETKKALGIKED